MRTNTRRCFHFRWKKCCKMVPEINLSVKTPLYKLSMGDASSGLWAPEILNEQFIDPVPGVQFRR